MKFVYKLIACSSARNSLVKAQLFILDIRYYIVKPEFNAIVRTLFYIYIPFPYLKHTYKTV